MRFINTLKYIGLAAIISGCALTPPPEKSFEITAAEAKAQACPQHILDAGATQTDCKCVETELLKLGKSSEFLTSQNNVFETFEGTADTRSTAIGLIRLTAFETCGFFEKDHPVERNLTNY